MKTLIQHGANANAISDTGSTPVRAACYDSNVEVVKYLVEHGANINIPNMYGDTCLMHSVESVELCSFLIESGANVNAQSNYDGSSAIHHAIRKGEIETVKLLLKHESDPYLKNHDGDDALQTACVKRHPEILQYLVSEIKPSPERNIEAYELLGACFLNDKYGIKRARQAWRFAMALRRRNPTTAVRKAVRSESDKAYKVTTEVDYYAELQAIASSRKDECSSERVYAEGLLIRERILGLYHEETLYGLRYRGALYADNGSHQRAIDLCKRAYTLKHEKRESMNHDCSDILRALCEFYFTFNDKYIPVAGSGYEFLQFTDVIQVTEMTSDCIRHQLALLSSPKEKLDKMLPLILHLIKVLCQLPKDKQQVQHFTHVVQGFVQLNPQTQQGSTLLHLAVQQNTSSVVNWLTTRVEFPSLDVVKVLLECGADVNCLDKDNNTPLDRLKSSEQDEDVVAIVRYLTGHKIRSGPNETGKTKRTTSNVDINANPGEVKCDSEDIKTILQGVTRDGTVEGKQLYSELQPHISVLLNAMSYKVQDNLVAAKLLSVNDIGHIKAKSTTHGMNYKMYQMVISRVKTASDRIDVKEAVCKGLCDSAQYCPFSRKERPASAIQVDTLNKIRLDLVSDAELNPVIDRLIQAQIIDEHIQQRIEAEKTTRDQVDVLLQFISRTHSRGHDTFMEILRDTHCWMFEDSTGK